MPDDNLPNVPNPLVFISFQSRDYLLARAFITLIDEASGGCVQTFTPSNIPYGKEWFPVIGENLRKATAVVSLLTRSSLDRPWIWFEAGVAMARQIPLYGIEIGISTEQTASGPFAAYQLCDHSADEIFNLVKQLLKGIDASKRAKMAEVRILVDDFVQKTEFVPQPPDTGGVKEERMSMSSQA